MNDLVWLKSTYSGASGGNCIEVAKLADGDIAIRDSKNPANGIIIVSAQQWKTFCQKLLAYLFPQSGRITDVDAL